MKVTAIWDRHIPAPESSTVFCLLNNGEFLEISLITEYQGTDAEGKRLSRETGEPRYGAVFNEKDRFTFEKADCMIKHFGGVLLINFRKEQSK